MAKSSMKTLNEFEVKAASGGFVVGILVSGVVGYVARNYTENPIPVIGAGMLAGIAVCSLEAVAYQFDSLGIGFAVMTGTLGGGALAAAGAFFNEVIHSNFEF